MHTCSLLWAWLSGIALKLDASRLSRWYPKLKACMVYGSIQVLLKIDQRKKWCVHPQLPLAFELHERRIGSGNLNLLSSIWRMVCCSNRGLRV
mmetsp:Transcript_18315/g.39399  ORF Transcript_18315/g.39399 Transcript_18315/m.39399 type:complete len:93 (+) Transcript_18315:239-517(+)